jgi:hypothetical protein
MHTGYVYTFVTFQKRKNAGIFFLEKKIVLISYVSQIIIYKSYVLKFATF